MNRLRRSRVVPYVVAAVLLRAADAGAIVGVVLEARDLGLGPMAGLLAACLTAPHLAGHIVGRVLDAAPRKNLLLMGAGALYGVSVSVAQAVMGASVPAAALLLLLAGLCGPLLTGGLSSRLTRMGAGEHSRARRLQSVDTLTYGAAGTLGPAAVGVISGLASPPAALMSVGAMAIVGGLAALLLPETDDVRARRAAPVSALHGVTLLVTHPGLRRTTLATVLLAVPLGAVPLLAVATTTSLALPPSSTALLTTAGGVGNLAASAALLVLPLRGSADRLMRWTTVLVVPPLVLAALPAGLVLSCIAFALIGAVTALQFAASLAARSAYSPPGSEGQVFVSLAGLKIAGASIGTAVIGALVGWGSVVLFLLAAALVSAVALVLVLDAARVPEVSSS